MLSPNEYMLKTRETAQYPPNLAVPYLTLGLVSEIGELHNTLYISDLTTKVMNVTKEGGDVLWYCFRLFDTIAGDVLPHWIDYVMPNDTLSRDEMINIMFVCASEVADVAKKAIRDNNGVIPEGKISRVQSALYSLIDTLSCYIWTYGITLELAAATNIAKLASRQERGVIAGSGDNR